MGYCTCQRYMCAAVSCRRPEVHFRTVRIALLMCVMQPPPPPTHTHQGKCQSPGQPSAPATSQLCRSSGPELLRRAAPLGPAAKGVSASSGFAYNKKHAMVKAICKSTLSCCHGLVPSASATRPDPAGPHVPPHTCHTRRCTPAAPCWFPTSPPSPRPSLPRRQPSAPGCPLWPPCHAARWLRNLHAQPACAILAPCVTDRHILPGAMKQRILPACMHGHESPPC